MKQSFSDHLRRFGPQARSRCPSLTTAQAYCRQFAWSQYENFLVGSLLLPRRLRPHFFAVYAWCRWADNLADEVENPYHALALLDWWREELLHAYHGDAWHPVLVALQATLKQFHIPAGLFLDLLSAFSQDQVVKEYQTFDQVLDYCRRSANPVGRIVLHLFDRAAEEYFPWADAICTGLQLVNFWQDVRRDLDRGRVYLPREDRIRFGYRDSDLGHRRYNQAFAELMAFEVARARSFLLAGTPLVDQLPKEFGMEVRLIIAGGLAVLDAILEQGGDVWRCRPVISPWTKGRWIAGCLLQRLQESLIESLSAAREPLPLMPVPADLPGNAGAISTLHFGCCPAHNGRP